MLTKNTPNEIRSEEELASGIVGKAAAMPAAVCTPIPIQFPVSGLGKAVEYNPNVWTPATHVGDLAEVPGSGFDFV